jgi:hypothetical protein
MLRELEVWEMEEVNGGECPSGRAGLLCRAWEWFKDAVFINELVDPFRPHSNPDNVLVMVVEDRSSGWTAPSTGAAGLR